MNLYIGNLTSEVTDDDLQEHSENSVKSPRPK